MGGSIGRHWSVSHSLSTASYDISQADGRLEALETEWQSRLEEVSVLFGRSW